MQAGNAEAFVVLDLSHFKANQPYLLEILSISFGLFSGVYDQILLNRKV